MKKVLIYGDSNVWGDNAKLGRRIDDSKQWVNILKSKLDNEWIIIQEGLPGRIAGNENKIKPYQNGKDTFISIFRTSAPIDTLIIALGTNDLQSKYNKSVQKIIEDLKWYTEVINEFFNEEETKYFNNKLPDIYYLMPINFDSDLFDEESKNKRKELINYFKNDNQYNIIIPSDTTLSDGIHLDYSGHEYIANLVYESIFRNKK